MHSFIMMSKPKNSNVCIYGVGNVLLFCDLNDVDTHAC